MLLVRFKCLNTIWKAYLVFFPTDLTLLPNSFWAIRSSAWGSRPAVWNSRCWSEFEGAVESNTFVWVVVILKKRGSFSPKKRKKRKKRKKEKTKENGVKAVGSLHFIAALLCDNACVQAHVSSLIYPKDHQWMIIQLALTNVVLVVPWFVFFAAAYSSIDYLLHHKVVLV